MRDHIYESHIQTLNATKCTKVPYLHLGSYMYSMYYYPLVLYGRMQVMVDGSDDIVVYNALCLLLRI